MSHLVLLFDGTWNDETDPNQVTNIHRLKELIIAATDVGSKKNDPRSGGGDDPEWSPPRIFYDTGVGTRGWWDRIVGGVLGKGLSANVRQGYRFLSQFYQPERMVGWKKVAATPILVFGFSRGAFTARSLAGFVAAAGLLKKEHCNARNLAFAWAYYRTPPKQRLPADKTRLEAISHDVKIDFLGVFDTVGSLGVPSGPAGNWAGRNDKFHDTKLGSAIKAACHAVALDEHRNPFVPALFARPDNLANRHVEQVWFPGVHSDVGGGYGAASPGRTAIADLSLAWMVTRIRQYGAGLLIADPPVVSTAVDKPHDSLPGFVVSQMRPAYRLIDGRSMDDPPFTVHWPYRLAFPDISWRERVHRCVVDLVIEEEKRAEIEANAKADGKGRAAIRNKPAYLPPQLRAVASALRDGTIPMIGFDGEPMQSEAVNALLDLAEVHIGRRILPLPKV